jgi:phage-related baseplate assembly protein
MELKDMKIKTFKEFLEDKTNPVVYCLLSSNGKDFLAKESYKVELHQYNCQHDTFTIETPEDSFDAFNEYIMEHSRDLLGEPLTIKFHQYGKVVQHFSGIITRIYCKRQTGGGYGTLYISGNAPSILLDQGKACHSYENKTLKEIITLVSEGYDNSAQVDSSAGVNTTRVVPYTVQYNESDYDFICRLANLYGEYFYYDGSKLIFGNKLQETIDLGENLNLIDEDFTLEMKPQDFEYINYAIDRAEVYRKDAESACCEYKNNPIQTDAKNASKKLFKKIPQKYHSATSLEQSDIDLEEVVRQERDLRELSLKVTGRSRDPRLRMNTFACLTDINARAMETYRVIKISHYHSGMNYENSFEAIPMMRTPADYNAEAFPKAEQQPAIVKDNNDPQGMGRVRVQFFWQKGDELSPWIRMIQPYAGNGKGFYFIPEIGEEVMVDFENGNAERPFVLGAHYNGAAKSGYKPTTKAIHTQSGTKILLNDAEGSVRIEDAAGNSLVFDGRQKITLNSSIFEINTQQMLIRATDKLHITTNNYVLNVLSQLYVFTAWMKQQVSGFMQVLSNAALIKSTNALDIEAKHAKLSGKERAVLDSKKEAVVNSLGVAQLQGKQGNEYSNNGQGIAQAPLEKIGLAVVYFRPLEDWKGEFGFDWMRDKYFPFKNELAYKDIISSGYSTKEDEHGKRRDLTKDEAYSQLRGEYEHHPMQIDGIDENEYFAPYLTLFSKTFVDTLGIAPFARPKYEATLQLIVGIERELESFYIECTNPERINIRTEGLTDKNTTSLKKGGTITITCNQDLDKNMVLQPI